MTITGVVLAGGKSSRYGRPKMFEVYKGKQLYEYSVDAFLANHIKPVYIITNKMLADGFKKDNIELIIDQEDYEGPLVALYHGLKEKSATWFFVLAADMPFVTKESVRELLDIAGKLRTTDVEAIVPTAGGRRQPLFALYHSRAISKARNIVQENKKGMYHLLKELRVKEVPFSAKEMVFTNINRPSDWGECQEEDKK